MSGAAHFAGLAVADLLLSVTFPALIADEVGEVMARCAGVSDEMVSLILRNRCRRSWLISISDPKWNASPLADGRNTTAKSLKSARIRAAKFPTAVEPKTPTSWG